MSEENKKKRTNNSTIYNYFKILKTDSSSDVASAGVGVSVNASVTQPSNDQVIQEKQNLQLVVAECENGGGENVIQYDIGCFIVEINEIDDFTKYQLLTNHWVPDKNYSFPFSLHIKRGREEKRRVNHGHLENYEWLVFSKEKGGLFCKYCALFLTNHFVGGQKNMVIRRLVTEPLNKFAKLSGKDGDLNNHQMTIYHSQAVEKGKFFYGKKIA